ncbi:MAG: hypothetical protein AAF498_11640, partial [Pseudomonadota bacterium]
MRRSIGFFELAVDLSNRIIKRIEADEADKCQQLSHVRFRSNFGVRMFITLTSFFAGHCAMVKGSFDASIH